MCCNPQNHRIKLDVMRLVSKFNVEINDNYRQLLVKFPGPGDTPYERGLWTIRVTIPENYPFKSPSIGFDTQIFHPNIDQASGTVCLDVLNQKWTPLYELLTVFDTFLPQLLRYPIPQDPLNHCAAMILIRTPERYRQVVEMHVNEYANPNKKEFVNDEKKTEDDVISDLSDNQDCDEDDEKNVPD